jgi:hypothetical protein
VAELESDAATTLEAGGFLRVTRICPGWQTPAVADREQNGIQVVTARFNESGLEPVVWGDVERCRYLFGESRIEIDAAEGSEYSLAISRQPPSDDDAGTPTLFVLRLAVTLDGERTDFSSDFRVLPEGVEYRLEQEDGSLTARADPDGTLHVRAANGHFVCDDALSCRPEAPAP